MSARKNPREGDEDLSAKKQSETEESGHSKRSGKSSGAKPAGGAPRKQRVGDLGRALRTVYDDTLRESVPDEFLNLIGKLS